MSKANIHCPQAQNTRQHPLGPPIHLQLPDEANREYTQREVAEYCKPTVHVCNDEQGIRRHARSLLCEVESLPEVRDGLAVKEQDDPEDKADSDDDDNDQPQDDAVEAMNCETEQGPGNGDFGDGGRPKV